MAKGSRGSRGARGGFGAGNPNQMMQQVQRMQREMEKAQAEISEMTAEATAGGSAIRVLVNGDKVLQEIEIDKSVVDPEDVEMLQDLIIAAVNEAFRVIDKKTESRMGQVTGGAGLPLGF